jgi:hypothetical protein
MDDLRSQPSASNPCMYAHGLFRKQCLTPAPINLMTNAIKFTATSTRKTITVSVAVSREPPSVAKTTLFKYIPSKNAKVDPTTGEDWGTGQVLYLRLKVQDTGCGLNEEEMQVLFKRFSQASPRTHAQYGGSGLGLYICRQLAELHGGQIGVASEAGVGSTFGFFVMARKSEAPGHVHARRVMAHTPEFSADLSVSQGATPMSEDAPPTPTPVQPPVESTQVLAKEFDPKDLDILVVEDNLVNQVGNLVPRYLFTNANLRLRKS